MIRNLFRVSALAATLAFGATLAPAPAEARGVVVGMQLEPPGLDPTAGAAAAIREVTYANIFEGLTRFMGDGSVAPALARSWEISEDGLVYTFALAEGVLFHDGTPMTAADVKFTLDRARDPDSTNAQKQLFANIDSVEVIDDLTVQVTLSTPQGGFLGNMAWGDAVILSPGSAATNATNPVGTGPFRFAQWVQGDRVELVRNDDYWGEPARLDSVTFKFISDPNAAFAAMMAGDIDVFPGYPAPETLSLFEADPRFQLLLGSTEGETILSTNNTSGPLADVRVRRAIAHALDRQEIIDGAMFGFGTPIGTHFPPHSPDYLDLTHLSEHDPDLSRQLLAEAGFADGLRLRLTLPPPSYARRGGEIVAAQLRAVGIETETSNVEWAQWLEQVFRNTDYDLTIIAHVERDDINIYAREDYYFNYDNPAFRQLMADLDLATDPMDRREILHAAQRMIAEDYVNGFMFQIGRTGVAAAGLRGLWGNVPTPANDMTAVYWAD
ncbi:MAG: ABC transporter substrate-binding protein [Rhodobacteraceae bacterium]|nr:ABC transporter substrate-binding protein [Paracoccaceae bacterium]